MLAVAAGQRHVVGVADEADPHVLLVAQVVERLPDLPGELLGQSGGLVLVAQRRDQVPDARAARVALLIAHLADRLDAADLDPLDVLGDEHLLLAQAFLRLVVPDLDLDAPVQGPAIRGRVAGDRPRVAGPFERDRLGRQPERDLEELRHLAGALAREARVVAIDAREPVGERLRVGVTDEVQTHVPAVAHAVEDLAEPLDVAARDVRDAGLEADRRHDVRELDGLELLARDLLRLEPVAGLALEQRGIARPSAERLIVARCRSTGSPSRESTTSSAWTAGAAMNPHDRSSREMRFDIPITCRPARARRTSPAGRRGARTLRARW